MDKYSRPRAWCDRRHGDIWEDNRFREMQESQCGGLWGQDEAQELNGN